MRLRLIPPALLLAILFVTEGCGPRLDPGTGIEIKGSVTLDGKPITIGQVMAFPFTGIQVSGNAQSTRINADGTYSLGNVPAGFLRIVVKTTPFKGSAMALGKKNANPTKGVGAPTMEGTFIDAPAIYEDPEKTPLNLEAKGRGVITYDIEMKSNAASGDAKK